MAETGAISWQTGWRGTAVQLLCGVGIALGQAPTGLFWLAFPAIVGAVLLGINTPSARLAARRGWVIGFGFAVVTFSWIVSPFLVDAATYGWMAPFALLLMAAGIGAFWGLAFWGARLVAGASILRFAISIVVFWTGTEILRSYALTGFPWGLTAYVWLDTPLYQFASFVGPHGVTFGTLLLAAALAVSLKTRRPHGAIIGIAGLTVATFVGSQMQRDLPQSDDQARPVIRLIQPNASQRQKWDPAMMPVFYDRQLSLSAPDPSSPVDLVIWPEVAVPFLLVPGQPQLREISDAAGGVPVIFGAQRLVVGQAFNSLAVLGENGDLLDVYDKQHLVPFGEYMPLAPLFARLGIDALADNLGRGYTAGPGVRVLDIGPLGKVLPSICYETIFPHELWRVSVRPDWMLQITNDAWFGAISGPYQHLAQARARAVEFALPMVRVANTGISAVIDSRGNIVNSMPLGVSGRLDVALPAPLAASVYWKTGDTPVILLLIVFGFAIWVLRYRNPIDRKSAAA